MKKESLFKFLGCLAVAFVVAFSVGWLFDLSFVSDVFFGEGGCSLAMAVAGVVGPGTSTEGGVTHQSTEEDNGELHELDLDKIVVKVRPSETPTDTIMRNMKNSRKTGSIQTGGFEIGTRDVEDKVTDATTGTRIRKPSRLPRNTCGFRTIRFSCRRLMAETANR